MPQQLAKSHAPRERRQRNPASWHESQGCPRRQDVAGGRASRLVADAGKHEYSCAEDIVDRESRILHRNSHSFCTRRPPNQPRQPLLTMKKVELGGAPWNPQWDQIIEQALPPEMLSSRVPTGVRQFCPRFYEMGVTDKRAFWAYFFQALAGAEAGLNPNTSVRHTEPDVTKRDEIRGTAIRTEGLLELAYADQRRYGCDFNWQADRALKAKDPAKTILQPKNNLECGVKILVNQIILRHKPLLTRSGYWSTLQPDGPSCRVFARQMTNPPPACGLTTKSKIDQSATTKSVQDDANRGETPQ